MTITGAKLSLWLGIAGGAMGVLTWLWNTAGTARHNRDVAAWTIQHQALQDKRQGWVVKQLGHVSHGDQVDWDSYPNDP